MHCRRIVHAGIMRAMRTLTVLAISALAALGLAGPVSAASYDTHLTRAPYLTDLVGLHVIVNFATDQSGTTASVSYGPFDGTTCTLPSTKGATRSTVKVGTVSEYQWKASLTLPSAGQYCYRVMLGGVDLLGAGDSPVFMTQAACRLVSAVLVRGLRRLGPRRCERQQSGSAEPPRHARRQRRPLRGHDRRQRLPVRKPDELRRSEAGRGRDGRDLRRSLLARSRRLRAALHGIRQSRAQRHRACRPHQLAAGCRRLELGRPLRERPLLLRQRDDRDQLRRAPGTPSTPGRRDSMYSTSAWGDTNPGTASVYANDYAAHFAPGTPEYTWLLPTSRSHPSGLKFAFSHYPFYSDDKSQGSDTFIDGPNSLEGLFATYGVNIAFNGHSHVYERNVPSAPGAPFTYISGGGGGTLEPIGPCHSFDAFGLGWSPTKLKGTSCGGRHAATSASQVFHFIKVTVSGTTVTVAPTDELGRTFDVQTYSFANAIADTVIDSGPANPSNSATATFSFHSTIEPATFACAIDGATAAPCTSPVTYSGSRGRQPFVLRVGNCRLGGGSDTGRPHLDDRRDRTDGSGVGRRHGARPERRRPHLERLERRRRRGRVRHHSRRRRHRLGGRDPDELLRCHGQPGDDLSLRRSRARRRREHVQLLGRLQAPRRRLASRPSRTDSRPGSRAGRHRAAWRSRDPPSTAACSRPKGTRRTGPPTRRRRSQGCWTGTHASMST